MKIVQQAEALHVIGMELRTSNAQAFETIPPFWQRFAQQGGVGCIAGRLSDDVYAVYTHFEHAGLRNDGLYSLVIGATVPASTEVPPGRVRVTVPAGRRALFEVEGGRPEQVCEAWMGVWQHNGLPKSYIADYERHRAEGGIDILVGLHPAKA